MKLHNQSLKYLSVALLGIITVWAVAFYFTLMDEVYDSLDDGLDNTRQLIIQRAARDSTLISRSEFRESNYSIRPIGASEALAQKDVYTDTLMYMQNEDDLEPVRTLTTAFQQDGQYYRLQVITSMVEEDDLLEDFLWGLLWLYLILLAAIIIINNVVLRKLWKPFYSILDQLRNYRVGKDSLPPSVATRVTEFEQLKMAADELFSHTLQAFNHQKQFIENAAHELQTPLAASINKLEILLESAELKEADMEQLAAVIEILQRLTRFNRSLLLLARIENKQFLEEEEVNLNDLAQEAIESFDDYAQHRQVNISMQASTQLTAQMNPDLARILMANLLKNAIVHNTTGGTVSLNITGHTFQICNTGSSTALDSSKVFQRFAKETTGAHNTGLGLAIVKAIAQLYGIEVQYHFDGQHCFQLNFLD